jgi:hypothetical protein
MVLKACGLNRTQIDYFYTSYFKLEDNRKAVSKRHQNIKNCSVFNERKLQLAGLRSFDLRKWIFQIAIFLVV